MTSLVTRTTEWLVVGYFTYLSLVAFRTGFGRFRRLLVWGGSAVICATVVMLAFGAQSDLVVLGRDWLPAAYILAAYYMTGVFIDRPLLSQEEWLKAWDTRLIPSVHTLSMPTAVRGYLEVVYHSCLLMLPAGLILLLWFGLGHLADHYWTRVTAAEFGAFASLPWFQTRPPWIAENLEPEPEFSLKGLKFFWLRHTSVNMNTFPSGHAAGSLAVALAIVPWVPVAGIVLFFLAMSIAAASVIGRYHYALDAITGMALACVTWGLAWAAGV